MYNVVIKVIALYVAICAVVFGTYLSLTYYETFYAATSLLLVHSMDRSNSPPESCLNHMQQFYMQCSHGYIYEYVCILIFINYDSILYRLLAYSFVVISHVNASCINV